MPQAELREGETSVWPLLSFSLHAQLVTWRAEGPCCSFATRGMAAGWCHWSPAPRDGCVPGSHVPAPQGTRWTKPGQKGGSASRSLAEHLCCPLLPSCAAAGQGGSPSPPGQQPPTRALRPGIPLLPPLSRQPSHHGQNQAYIWDSTVKSSKALTACEEPPELLCAGPGCNTRKPPLHFL